MRVRRYALGSPIPLAVNNDIKRFVPDLGKRFENFLPFVQRQGKIYFFLRESPQHQASTSIRLTWFSISEIKNRVACATRFGLAVLRTGTERS
jgi:hypothetical protein